MPTGIEWWHFAGGKNKGQLFYQKSRSFLLLLRPSHNTSFLGWNDSLWPLYVAGYSPNEFSKMTISLKTVNLWWMWSLHFVHRKFAVGQSCLPTFKCCSWWGSATEEGSRHSYISLVTADRNLNWEYKLLVFLHRLAERKGRWNVSGRNADHRRTKC